MKRILLVLAAIAAVGTTAVWFAAQESYVTTVSATIGTSLDVTAHGTQNYGLLFGQETRSGAMLVRINPKAKADSNLIGVDYTVGCNDGPTGTNASSICPFIDSDDFGFNKLDVGIVQSQDINWIFTAPDCLQSAQKKTNPITVPCSQDKNWFLSGQIYIDVIGYQGYVKQEICDKKTGLWVSGTSGVPILIFGETIECELGDTFNPFTVPAPD
ncbi:MAG: hypothetical protein IIB88_04470 [Chloroflexi bacterium]|nr:hypothetical protein [Chloroflexota bacterium]